MKKFILGIALLTGFGAAAQSVDCPDAQFTYAYNQYYNVLNIEINGDIATFEYYYVGDTTYQWPATYNYEDNTLEFSGIAYYNENDGNYYFPGDTYPLELNDEFYDCLGIEDYVSDAELCQLTIDSVSADLAAANANLDACGDSNADLTAQVSGLEAEVSTLNDSINGLEGDLAQANMIANNALFVLDNCFEDNNELDATIAALNQENLDQQALIDSLLAANATLTADVDYYSNNLQSCTDAYSDLGQSYVDLTYSYDSLQAATDATVAALTDVVLELNDDLNETTLEFVASNAAYEDSILGLQVIINNVNTELSDCTDAVNYNAAMIQDLQAQLATCGSDLGVAEDEVLYWMDLYGAYVDACAAAIDSLEDECAQTATDAYQNGYDYGYETGLLEVSLGYEACLEANETNAQIIYGLNDQVAVLTQQLEDCEGTTGIDIVDMNGNVVTQVIGYYNELGQIIDPRGHRGLVIRRHADGTFSKYIK